MLDYAVLADQALRPHYCFRVKARGCSHNRRGVNRHCLYHTNCGGGALTLRVRDLAQQLGLDWVGLGEQEITGAARLEDAGPSELSFAATPKALRMADGGHAGCLIAPLAYHPTRERTVLWATDPRAAFARALSLLYPEDPVIPGVHSTAVVDPRSQVDPSSQIGPHVTVAERAEIGPSTVLGPGCVVGAGARIGAGCRLHSYVIVYPGVVVGDRAVLHSGCVLGADGFGFAPQDGRWTKFPQIGTVILGDDVEVGANSCVDRAALGATTIGDGSKLDNQVHVGHNCQIGRHVVIAAQTGISGGVVIGDHAVIGGQVGIGDKAKIEARAVLGSGSGVLTSKIVRAGEPYWGTPARPLRKYLRQLAAQGRVADLESKVEALEARLQQLKRAPLS